MNDKSEENSAFKLINDILKGVAESTPKGEPEPVKGFPKHLTDAINEMSFQAVSGMLRAKIENIDEFIFKLEQTHMSEPNEEEYARLNKQLLDRRTLLTENLIQIIRSYGKFMGKKS